MGQLKLLRLAAFAVMIPGLALAAIAPINVFLGGFASCAQGYLHGHHAGPHGTKLIDNYEEMLKELARSGGIPAALDQATVIAACFDYLPSYPGRLHIAVIRRNDKGRFEIVGHQQVEPYTMEHGKLRFENVVLKNAIEELSLEQDSPRPVNLIGHSYGGDLAMRTALMLDAGVKIRNLITIDPIDMETCRHNEVTFERTELLLGRFPELIKGCTEAPEEISHADQMALLDRTGNQWYHYYQKLNARLHGDTFADVEAAGHSYNVADGLPRTASDKFTMPGMLTAHGMLANHPTVWKRIRAMLTE